jgi:hypothetical protein
MKDYSPTWLIPVCAAVAVIVLVIDLRIKDDIVTESLKLREAISEARPHARTSGNPGDHDHDRGRPGVDGTGPVETGGRNFHAVPAQGDDAG